MAKSTRSKVKRQYRAKKREEGVYAAIEAARLGRLSAKLAAVKNAKNLVPIGEEDGENDEQLDAMDGGKLDAGSLWFLAFALIEPGDISLDTLEYLTNAVEGTWS